MFWTRLGCVARTFMWRKQSLKQCASLETPFTRFNRLSNRLFNRLDNRLYRVNGVLSVHSAFFLHTCRRADRDGVDRSPDVARLQQICGSGAVLQRVSAVQRSAGGRQRPSTAVNVDQSATGRHLSRPVPAPARRGVPRRVRVCPTYADTLRYDRHTTRSY